MAHVVDPDGHPHHPQRLPQAEQVDAAAFFSLDIRVGRVIEVRPFPQARNPSWQLRVDFGPVVGELETSAQLTNYAAVELLGRSVIGVVNLPPRPIAGFTSQFLILAGLEASGVARLLGVDADLPPGSRVA